MQPSQVFEINTPRVVHESIDGEVVMIDFDSGNYFSSDELGCAIWTHVQENQRIEQIVARVNTRFDFGSLDSTEVVCTFLQLLLDEQLIRPLDSAASAEVTTQVEAYEGTKTVVSAPPTLQKFGDMQELLILDPIHDVDEVGWPKQKPAEA